MTTGHVNPGYHKVVSRFKSALENPTGSQRNAKFDLAELDQIRLRARSVWSVKDKSQTTYGFYHNDPLIKEKAEKRPSSPTRQNNPHPHLYIPFFYLKSKAKFLKAKIFYFVSVYS